MIRASPPIAPPSLPVQIVPSGSPSGAECASASLEWSAKRVVGVLVVASATTELRTSELSWGGGNTNVRNERFHLGRAGGDCGGPLAIQHGRNARHGLAAVSTPSSTPLPAGSRQLTEVEGGGQRVAFGCFGTEDRQSRLRSPRLPAPARRSGALSASLSPCAVRLGE